MITVENTEILFFREIWLDGHDLARKKPKLRFFRKIYPTTMI
jgi:hypothetical protein